VDIDISELSRMCNGQWDNKDFVTVTGYSIDSRTINPGDLFIPLIADRDGHEFISSAMEAGAAAHLFSHGERFGPAIKVADTSEALKRLGREALKKLSATTLGITGSVGKTTTKDMARSCYATLHKTWASDRSYNNEIGLPLTILAAPDDSKFLILEMGARGIGHIRELCEISRPQIGIITRIGLAHSEYFGDIKKIIRAKGELVESLDSGGLAVLNHDDQNVKNLKERTSADVIFYGTEGGDVVGGNIVLDHELKPSFEIESPWGNSHVRLNISGEHNVANALAAASAALYSNVPLEEVVNGLETVEVSPLRMETFLSSSGALVINDSYNANPMSMKAALETLVSSGRENLFAVLGVMAELGEESAARHKDIGEFAELCNVEVISIGVQEYEGAVVASIDEAINLLKNQFFLDETAAVLIKGSRVVGLEGVADSLK